jgi:hypothetical protein
MNNLLNGAPKVVIITKDASSLGGSTRFAPVCVIGATQMGKPFTPTLITGWKEFVDTFGDVYTDGSSNFPFLCKRALEAGGSLYVSRVAHLDGNVWDGVFASGTITEGLNTMTFEAREVGAGYNNVQVTIRAARSRTAGKVDVVETYNGTEYVVRDINLALTPDDADALNNGLRYTTVSALPVQAPIGTATLLGGAQLLSNIVEADYIGAPNAETKGLYSFDNVYDAMRIANLDNNTATFDAAIVAYCELRGDMRAMLAVPTQYCYAVQDMVDYRENGGLDTPLADLYAGVVKVLGYKNGIVSINAIGDIVGLRSKLDAKFLLRDGTLEVSAYAESVGTVPNCFLPNNMGVGFNLNSPTSQSDYDYVCNKQINLVVQDHMIKDGVPALYTIVRGNRTLTVDQSKKSRNTNVMDFVVYFSRLIKPLLKDFILKPNVVSQWKALYGRARRVIEASIAADWIRDGENKYWQWQGDQDIANVDKLPSVPTTGFANTKPSIEAGEYKVNFVCVPTTLMETITLTITHTTLDGAASLITLQ